MPTSRPRRAVLATLGLAALAAGSALVAPAADTALATPATHTGPSGGRHAVYYTVRPACGPARPGHVTCFALRRVAHTHRVPNSTRAETLPDTIARGPAGGYTPADLAVAYGMHRTLPTTQTVAVIDAYNDPKARADLNTFDAQYNLPAETSTSFQQISQYGSAVHLPPANVGWAEEESLDLDAVRGMCNKCKILLVEAKSTSLADLAAAENRAVIRGARIITNSYGGAEGTSRPPASILNAYNHPGVVITASSGDLGYYSWSTINYGSSRYHSAEAPEFPSSYQTVVAVGGTRLAVNPSTGAWAGETVWNGNGRFDQTGARAGGPLGATGGGCSRLFNPASWQASVYFYRDTACGRYRSVADVAADADPVTGLDVYDSYGSAGWETVGGTSLSAPLVAAMWGLAGGGHGARYPSSNLYDAFIHHRSTLHDISSGGNGMCDTPNGFACGDYWGGSTNTFTIAGHPFGTTDCFWRRDSNARSSGTRACNAVVGFDGPSGVGTPRGMTSLQ